MMSLAFVHVSAQCHFVFWLPGSLLFISDKMQDIGKKQCMEKHCANVKGMTGGLGWWPSGCFSVYSSERMSLLQGLGK